MEPKKIVEHRNQNNPAAPGSTLLNNGNISINNDNEHNDHNGRNNHNGHNNDHKNDHNDHNDQNNNNDSNIIRLTKICSHANVQSWMSSLASPLVFCALPSQSESGSSTTSLIAVTKLDAKRDRTRNSQTNESQQ